MGQHYITNQEVFALIREADNDGLTASELGRLLQTERRKIYPHLHRLLQRQAIADSGQRRSVVPGKVKGFVYVAR